MYRIFNIVAIYFSFKWVNAKSTQYKRNYIFILKNTIVFYKYTDVLSKQIIIWNDRTY